MGIEENLELQRNELQRINKLKQYEILDTLPEEQFDRFTRLATFVSDSPIALISLIDDKRQWFKSKVGLDINETEKNISFCQYAIKDVKIFEVENAELDNRFSQNPLVTGNPNIKFYAGQPLIDDEGFALGTLCVIDTKPKMLSEKQRLALRDLADEVMQNIVDRKRTIEINDIKAKLEKSTNLFNDAQQIAKIGAWELDINSGSSIWTDQVYEIFEVDKDFELRLENGIKFFHEEDKQQLLDALNEAASEYKDFDIVSRLISNNKNLKYLRIVGKAIFNEKGEKRLVGMIQDITEKHLIEKQMLESKEKYKSLVNNIPGVTYRSLFDEDWTTIFASEQILKISGYHYKDFLYNNVRSFASIMHPDDIDRVYNQISNSINNDESWEVEYRLIHKDGTEKWVYEKGNVIKNRQGFIEFLDGFFIDITQRKLAEEKLMHLNELQAVLMKISSEFVNAPLEKIDQYINESLLLIGNYVDADRVYVFDYNYEKNICINTYEWCKEGVDPQIQNLQELPLVFNEEWFNIHQQGNLVFIEDVASLPEGLLKDILMPQEIKSLFTIPMMQDNVCTGFIGFDYIFKNYKYNENEKQLLFIFSQMLLNIQTRFKTYKKLKKTSNQLESIFNEINDVVWSRSLVNDDKVFYTPSVEKLYELPIENFENNPKLWRNFVHPEDKNILEQFNIQLEKYSHYEAEYRIICPSGKQKWVKDKTKYIKDREGKNIRVDGIVSDITETKVKEFEINKLYQKSQEQNQKLQNFAHIVSHNLRSHSGNISMLLDFFIKENQDFKENQLVVYLQEATNKLLETINHLNDVVSISVDIKNNLTDINLSKVVESALMSVTALAESRNIKIANHVDKAIFVKGVNAYLDSIVLNFITNAIKYSDSCKDSFVKISCVENENDVILEFEDNGLGINLKLHGEKLFGLYKTFHGNQDAKGIGLFIVKNQIEAIGGNVEVESAEGIGTKFKVLLRKSQ
jgi:PAS domain S-box-containing protein